MSEMLRLPVTYNGEDLLFDMEMINWTYTHRFRVQVQDELYLFEPDEEGQYRAISEDNVQGRQGRMPLLQQIGETLSQLMNNA